jgi:hypothetical protein
LAGHKGGYVTYKDLESLFACGEHVEVYDTPPWFRRTPSEDRLMPISFETNITDKAIDYIFRKILKRETFSTEDKLKVIRGELKISLTKGKGDGVEKEGNEKIYG